MGLGFVVARSGLLLALLSGSEQPLKADVTSSAHSTWLGIVLVALSVIVIVSSAIQHHRFLRTLPKKDLPALYSNSIAVWSAFAIGFIGVLVVVYLLPFRPLD
jgi:uncharacterized membrane protein YidH (DUF202 family)